MFRQHGLRYLFLVAVAALLWTSCRKSDFDGTEFADHTAEFAFPLFSTTLNLSDLMSKVLNDSLSGDTITINPDYSMTLFYSGDVAEKKATDIFGFFPNGIIPVLDTIYYAPFSTPDSVTVRRVVLNNGTLNLVVFNSGTEPINGTFYIPQMSKNGQVFQVPFVAPPNPNFPWISSAFQLKDWELESDTNALYFRYEAYLPNGDRIKLPEPAPGTPGLGILLQNMTFSYLEGYWGYDVYPLTLDTIDIDINQTNLVGDVTVVDPKVTMTVSNSWGFPTRGVVKYLSFIGRDGQEYKLESPQLSEDSLDFNYPSWAAGEIGQTKETHYVFDRSNSNIDVIFNSQPTQMIYELEGISNAQRDFNITGFITDSSTIKLRVAVELLLEGTARNFGAEQTLNLNFGEYANLDSSDIESVEFKLVAENGTPIGADLQIYFRDSMENTIDSLFTEGTRYVMQAAPVDANGNVTGIGRTETFIPMGIDRFNRVRTARSAYVRNAFTTAQDGTIPVKLKANQDATLKMGVKVKLRLGGG
jgi:hypothetical protein